MILETYTCQIVLLSIVLPLSWWAIMFAFQLFHWWFAWLDDSEPTTNVVMNFAMIHFFGYRKNTSDRDTMLYEGYDENCRYTSDGVLAIWTPIIVLLFIPIGITLLIDYYQFVSIVLIAYALSCNARAGRRLSKTVRTHMADKKMHRKKS